MYEMNKQFYPTIVVFPTGDGQLLPTEYALDFFEEVGCFATLHEAHITVELAEFKKAALRQDVYMGLPYEEWLALTKLGESEDDEVYL